MDICVFEASLVYTVSSRARQGYTEKAYLEKNKKSKKQKQNKTKLGYLLLTAESISNTNSHYLHSEGQPELLSFNIDSSM